MWGNRIVNDGEIVKCWVVVGKGVVVKFGLDVCDDILKGWFVILLFEY